MPELTPQHFLFGKRTRRPPKAKGAGKLNAAQRTMKFLRDRGWTAEVTEKYIHRVEGKGQQMKFSGGYRKDLFGFCDVLAYRQEPTKLEVVDPHDYRNVHVCILAIQTTSRAQMTAHLRQYRDGEDNELRDRLRAWMAMPGAAFLIHGWEPLEVPNKSTSGTHVEWTLTERLVTPADLTEEPF